MESFLGKYPLGIDETDVSSYGIDGTSWVFADQRYCVCIHILTQRTVRSEV